MTICILYVNQKMQTTTEVNEQRYTWQILNNTIKQTDSFFEKNETMFVELSKFASLLENDTTLLRTTLTQLLENNSELRSTFIHFYDSTKKLQLYLIRDKNQIQKAVLSEYISEMKQKSLQDHFEKNNNHPFWDNPTISVTDDHAYINLYVPFYDKSKRLKGFIGFNMNLKWVDSILNSVITFYEKDAHAFIFMMSQDGYVISTAGNLRIKKNDNLIEASKDDLPFTSMLYNMRNRETDCIKLKSNFIETSNMFFFKSLTNKRISIALSFNKNQSMTVWTRQFIMILSVLIFFLGIITLWFWLYLKNRYKIVNNLEECLQEIEKGSTTAVLPSPSFHQDLQRLYYSIEKMQKGISMRNEERTYSTRAEEYKKNEIENAQRIRMYFYSSAFRVYPEYLANKIKQYVKKDYLSDSVGGDFHDYFSISPQQICFITGTVSRSKKETSNIQTAMDIIMTMTLLRSNFKIYSSLYQSVFSLNNDLYLQNNGRFTINAFIGVFNCETGVLESVSAGAPTPYMIAHRSIFHFPEQNGLPLASRRNEEYSIGKKELSNGDMLLIFTEGVVSRQNINTEKYGEVRLQQTMRAISMMDPEMFVEKIAENINDFTKGQPSQVDDYTLFAIKYNKT